MRAVIEIPVELQDRLKQELRRGGLHEIGGILMGECVEPARFRVVDVTVDHGSGTISTFVRPIRAVLQPLTKFFKKTGKDYCRFNYLGEWHSHPSFPPFPSRRDVETIQSIADDPSVGANFVVLLIVKLNQQHLIEGSVTIFQANVPKEMGTLILMQDNAHV